VRRRGRTLAITLAAAALLVVVAAAGLGVGATGFGYGDGGASSRDMLLDVRLPRVLLAALVGLSLAIAGLLAQTLTRNPLASAQTFGINAGAAVAIVTATIAFPVLGGFGTVAAFIGAAAVGLVMWALSTSGRVTVVGLALAGMTLQIMLSAVVQAILIMNNASQDIVFWLAGSVTGADWADIRLILPFAVAGCLAALLGSRQFGLLALDPTTATALGQHTARSSGLAALIVIVLAGASVAVAGPIGFVGLIVPHIARRLVGAGFAVRLVLCLVLGPLLLVSADLVARLIAFPKETPAGIVTALIGAPVFLVLAIRQRRA
jgi:iron complex transport system permease protein